MTERRLFTLTMVHQRPRLLLGLKKRGFATGKWNGFGGKVGDGEDVEAAARRELREECGVEALDLAKLGVLTFDGVYVVRMEVHVFRTTRISGEPVESEEMMPRWYPEDALPYHAMWHDNRIWFPLMLDGKRFSGHFVYDGQDGVILRHELHVTGSAQ